MKHGFLRIVGKASNHMAFCRLVVIVSAFFLSVPSLIFTSCSDEETPSPVPGEGEVDNYIGEARMFSLGQEASGLNSSDITLKILAPDGNIISRRGIHVRSGNISNFTLGNGLKDGTYRLLYAEYPITDNPELSHLADKYNTAQFGLGCRVQVKGNEMMLCDGFDDGIGLSGSGTKEDPYIISSYSHLIKLLKYVNSYDTNKKITSETYFKQTNPIDMEQASFECDMRYGWLPIGADTNTPFRGVYLGDEISWLWIDRPSSSGVGLFGYVYQATFEGVKITNAKIKGNFAVGGLAGAVISGGDEHGESAFADCSVSESEIAGSAQSWSVGGLVGALDMYSKTLVQKSSSEDNRISGSYDVGGLVGGCGLFSSLSVADCTSSSAVTSEYSGAGGMVGVADTLNVVGCRNSGKIVGASAYKSDDKSNTYIGAGGICGGSGISWISASTNSGEVSGINGVGGIIGSTRIKGGDGDAYVYNNTLLRWCGNTGAVSGRTCVGGMCGEAQFGCYGVVNKGNVTGGDYTAGIVGNTSIVVAHNAVNSGSITGGSYTAGIVGKTTWGSVAINQNYGNISGNGSHTAGIMGLAGNNTIVHYCGNFGSVSGAGSGLAGGIVAEIGDPREWTAMNITECVVGSLEVVMAFAGPIIAVAEHAIEATAKGVAIALKVTETAADVLLTATDACLATHALVELLSPEKGKELESSLHDVMMNVSQDIKNEMGTVRKGFSGISTGVFNNAGLAVDYNNNISSTLEYYEIEGNDEIFNENINKRREERMEKLEKAHHTGEIVHEVIAGVAIVASTVAIIGGIVASGGAAAPFVLMGGAAAFVGGTNAIVKAVTDFEQNAVVISQCVNAGVVTAGEEAGGIVGRLQDNSLMTDCLNTAAISEPLVSDPKSNTRLEYCMVLNDAGDFFTTGYADEIIYYSPNSVLNDDELSKYAKQGRLALSAEDIGDVSIYNRNGVSMGCKWEINWSIGEDKSKWMMSTGGGYSFPVPAYSEMRE